MTANGKKPNGTSSKDVHAVISDTGLSAKQEAFANAYALGASGTQAAKEAGYSPGSAANQAVRLLKNAKVREAVAKAKARLRTQVRMTEDQIIAQLEIEALREGSGASHAARIKALELLAKMKGMLVERQETETVHHFAVSDTPELTTDEWVGEYCQ